MISTLLLLSGNDIPFPEARVTIHQPTLKEIAYLGEEKFFVGCGFLNFSKDLLDPSDKVRLKDYDDFDIFMSMMIRNDKETKYSADCASAVLELIFPLYTVSVRDNCILLQHEQGIGTIDKYNYSAFKKILVDMFQLNLGKNNNETYNPVGQMSERIAEKFRQRHQKLAKLKGGSENKKEISILSRYVSILAVGLQQDLNELMQYTVCQLYDEFQRFQLKMQWDAYIQARMAGAKDLEEVDNWTIDLQDQGKNKNKK